MMDGTPGDGDPAQTGREPAWSGFDLRGRVALVTGGSRGLGRAMARGLASAGASVVVASRNLDSCTAVASAIEQETGRTAVPLGVHVGHWDELEPLVAATVDRLGRLDVLINNAGMSPLYHDLPSVTEALFDKVLAVNLKAPFRLAVAAAEHMVANGGGSIINISSMGAVRPQPHIVPYAAAKAGLNAVTVALAHAYGPSVRCNAIMAGTFATDVSQHWDPETIARRTATFAAKRVGEPDEIVGTALYLASSASSYTTGSIIAVDGGQP